MATWELRVQSHPEQLKEIRQWLGQVGGAVGLAQDEIANVKVAVCEACTNIIRHAYEGNYSRPIWLTARSQGSGIELEIRDFGRPFDHARVSAPDFEEAHEGGYGVFLMRKLMDAIEFSSPADGEGTVLRMVKARHSTKASSQSC
ncbi:MAG TPA: ATP-binding protein [Methylomirabilota bacterium]|nr:ATP-binding protein [Methylomirabilota bacterium]